MIFDLVFEGGGARGMAFVGAIETFQERGHECGRLLGTSAGAITATLLAAGYTAEEMLEALDERLEDGRSVFNSFLGVPDNFSEDEVARSVTVEFLRSIDIPLVPEWIEKKLDAQVVAALMAAPRYRHLFSFVERGGWFSADQFVGWMERRLDMGRFRGKTRNLSGMSFRDFNEATGVDLTLVASDTTSCDMLVLNHRTAPDCPVVWATRMSMSIPLLWQEVIWRPEWGRYRGRDMEGHIIVDGGMLSNFPLELFISESKPVTDVMGPKTSDRILGLLIDESTTVPAPAARLIDPTQLRTVQRLGRLLNTMMLAHDKMVMDALQELVVRLPAGGYGVVEFDMSDERKMALIKAARLSSEAYFDKFPEGAPVSRGDLREAERTRRSVDRLAEDLLAQ